MRRQWAWRWMIVLSFSLLPLSLRRRGERGHWWGQRGQWWGDSGHYAEWLCCLLVYSLSLFGVEEREGIGEDRESSDEETVGITLNECVVCLLPLSLRRRGERGHWWGQREQWWGDSGHYAEWLCCLLVYSLSLFGVEEREGIGEDRESSDEETVGITLNECVVCLLPLSLRRRGERGHWWGQREQWWGDSGHYAEWLCCLLVYSLSLFGVEEREGIGEDRESSDEETVGITLNDCVVCLLPLSSA